MPCPHPCRSAVTILLVLTPLHSRAAEPTLTGPPESIASLPMCPEERLFDAQSAPAPLRPALTLGEGVTIDGDYLAGEFEGEAILRGNVVISEGDRSITAGELRVNPITKAASVRGTVEYRDPAIVIRGDAGKFSGGEAQVDGAEFELPQQPARGAARSLSLNQAGVLTLEGVSYNTCHQQTAGASRPTRFADATARRRHRARVEFLGSDPASAVDFLSHRYARKTVFCSRASGSSRG